ncbi:MAG: hypothetical protein HY422_01490 [Candidatus Komeilibacteria bacterium]|nr:hypothetical protein [Candidatus Komeilibacteria bacterium]
MSKWLFSLFFVVGVAYLISLYFWWIYFLNQGIYLITLFDNPYQSHVPGYIIVAGFFSYPIFVLAGIVTLWIRRNSARQSVSVSLMIFPLISVLAFFGGAQFIQYRNEARFDADIKRTEMTARDFLCPNGKYLQVDEEGVVGLIEQTETSLDEQWAGNVDLQNNMFTLSVPWTGWYEEIKDCKNEAGEVFLHKFRLADSPENY